VLHLTAMDVLIVTVPPLLPARSLNQNMEISAALSRFATFGAFTAEIVGSAIDSTGLKLVHRKIVRSLAFAIGIRFSIARCTTMNHENAASCPWNSCSMAGCLSKCTSYPRSKHALPHHPPLQHLFFLIFQIR
jgi:hypothetical protein